MYVGVVVALQNDVVIKRVIEFETKGWGKKNKFYTSLGRQE